MLTAAIHLLLAGLEVVQHGGLVGEGGINGQRLHRHTHGMLETLVCATIVDGIEEGFLLVVVLCQKVGVNRCKQGTFIDTVLFAEGIHLGHVGTHYALHVRLRVFLDFQVGKKLGEGVATVEVLGVPAFALLESVGLAQLGLSNGQFRLCQLLRSERATVIDRLHIVNQDAVRGSVADKVVGVEEPVEVFLVLHQAGVEEPSAVELVGLDELPLLRFDVGDLLHGKAEFFFVHIDGLEGVAFAAHLNAGEERGMRLEGRHDGPAQALGVETTVKDIEIRHVVVGFVLVAYAFCVDAVLGFG